MMSPGPPTLEDGRAGERALRRFAACFALLLAAVLPIEVAASGLALDVLNAAVPALIFPACLWTAYRVVRANRWTLLTPLPWFLAAYATFCGLGPLVYTFGKDEGIAYMNQFCPVDAASLARTNRLNLVGLVTLIAGFLAGARALRGNRAAVLAAPRSGEALHPSGTKTAALVFLAIGLPVKYLLTLPFQFGEFNFVIPGTVTVLENCIFLGLLVLGYGSATAGKGWTLGLCGLVLVDFTVNFLLFQKMTLLLTLIMPLLGRYLATGRMRTLVLGGVGLFGVYMLVTPLTAWGHVATEPLAQVEPVFDEPGAGAKPRATLRERWEIVCDGVGHLLAGSMQLQAHSQSWWTRLSYVNVQTYAMTCYDADVPGDTFAEAPYVLVPRALWKEKPLIGMHGKDFTELALRHRGGTTELGIFGEAYWNGGWLLVLFISGLVGVLYAGLTRLAMSMLRRLGWGFLPCAFVGIKMGFRVHGWFVSDFLGPTVTYLAVLLMISLLLKPWMPAAAWERGNGSRYGS